MRFGQALQTVVEERGDTNMNAARIALVDNSTIGKYMKGTRKVQNDVMQRTAAHYDDPKLYIAAANDVTGDAWVPWLDNVDLHRASVLLKTLEEVDEAREALLRAAITKRLHELDSDELQSIQKAIKESVEAITALTHQVAVLCREYCISWMVTWHQHRVMLKERKYMK